MSLDLKITRTISTGVMFFIPSDEDRYDEIESTIISEFEQQPFADLVSLNVDDSEFCQYWLSADIDDEAEFKLACAWLLSRMESFDAVLDYVA